MNILQHSAWLRGLPLPMAAISLIASSAHLMGAFNLIDDMESGNHWISDTNPGGSVVIDPENPDNYIYTLGNTLDNTGAYLPLGVNSIADGTTGTLFFRVRTNATNANFVWGSSDVAAPTISSNFNFNQYEGYGRMAGDEFDVRNGGGFSGTGVNFTPDTWYNIWLVFDNATDQTTLYITEGTHDATGTTGYNGNFRNGTTEALQSLLLYCAAGQVGYLDDVYLDTNGENLDMPTGLTGAVSNFILIDNMESGDLWQSGDSNPGGAVITDPDDPDNQVYTLNNDNQNAAAYLPLGVNRIADGTTGTLFFRLRTHATNANFVWGSSDLATPAISSDFNFNQFEGYGRMAGTAFDVRNGGGFSGTGINFTPDTWYNIWLVLDNATDLATLYITEGTHDATGTTGYNGNFRNGTSDALQSFLLYSEVGEISYIDDIYRADGIDLTLPALAAVTPGGTSTPTSVDSNGHVTIGTSDIEGYSGQDLSGTTTISGDGTSVTLNGNNWKRVPLDYTVTPNTVLSVTVNATDTGEFIGIGLDDNNVFNDIPRIFQLGGSQTFANAIPVDWPYVAGEGEVIFDIYVGQYYTGVMSWLVFVADDDANASTDVTFSNVRLYEDETLEVGGISRSVWGYDNRPRSRHTELGTNVAFYNLNSRKDAVIFINQLKGATTFFKNNSVPGDDLPGAFSYDANGYPDTKPDGLRFGMEILRRSPELDGIAPFSGDFRLYGQGEGVFSFGVGSTQYDTATLPQETINGTTYWYHDFQYTSNSGAYKFILYDFTEGDHVRDLSVVHHTHLAAFRNGETFAPEWLADIEPYDTLRFMDWVYANNLNVNGAGESIDPLQRYIPTSYVTYNTNSSGGSLSFPSSMPIEHIVELCNLTDADAWINLPADIPDSQITVWATYVRDHLNSDHEVYWEFGNENWNGSSGFNSRLYCAQMGQTIFGISNHDVAAVEYASYRGAQCYQQIKDIFDAGSRPVRLVAPGWAWSFPMDSVLGGTLWDSYDYRLMEGEFGQQSSNPPPKMKDIATDYAVGLYFAAVAREDNTDTSYGSHLLQEYATPDEQAEAHARWILFGNDETVFHNLTTQHLTSPANIIWQEGLNIAVSHLVRADKDAGLDPIQELENIIRLNGADLQYQGVHAANWTTIARFDTVPHKTLSEMIHDVELIGESFIRDATTFVGLSASIRENTRIRLTNRVAYAEHLGLNLLGYEGGTHLYSPSSPEQAEMMEAFEKTGWANVVLNAWFDRWEQASVDLACIYMSHDRSVSGNDYWGTQDYVGQPLSESPRASFIRGTIALGTTPEPVGYDPVAAMNAPVMDPGILWESPSGNWTDNGDGSFTETEQTHHSLNGTMLSPLDQPGNQVAKFTVDITTGGAPTGKLFVKINTSGNPSTTLFSQDLNLIQGVQDFELALLEIPVNTRVLAITIKRTYNKNGDLTLSDFRLEPAQ